VSQRLLTTRDVANLVGLSPEAVLRRWRAGQIPGFRLAPNVLRFDEDEIVAWLDSVRSGPRYSSAGRRQLGEVA
jgi:predicted DNA-binding transcriptional regulator AlpA